VAIAEHAQLIVDIKLNDGLSAGIRKAQADVRTLSNTTLPKLQTAIQKIGAGGTKSPWLGWKNEALLAVGRVRDSIGNLGDDMRVKLSKAASGIRQSFANIGSGIRQTFTNLGNVAAASANRIKQSFNLNPLIKQGLALAGGATVLKAFTDSISKAEEFASATQKLGKVTGLSASDASALVDVLDKFGISGEQAISVFARLEKNAGTYAAAQAKANDSIAKANKVLHDSTSTIKERTKATADLAKAQGQFGFSVLDANGKVADANELLARSRDFFNSTATASEKATVLQKLYGKSWKDLIPILSLSKQKFDEQFQSALRLTPQQLKDAAALRGAQREFNDALGDTETLVGLKILPSLTKLARTAKTFIDQNQKGILAAVDGATKLAGQIGDAFSSVASGLSKAWGAVPDPLKDLLIKGFVADRTLKFLFGFSPAKFVVGLAGDAISKALGGLFQRGGSPASPLYTKEVGLPTGGLPVGGVTGGGGLLSKLGTAFAAFSIVADAALVFKTWQDENTKHTQEGLDLQAQQNEWLKKQPSRADLERGLAAVQKGQADIRSNPLLTLVQGDALTSLQAMEAQLKSQLAQTKIIATNSSLNAKDPLRATLINYLRTFRQTAPGGFDLHQAQNTVDLVLRHGGLGGSLTTLPSVLRDLQRERANAFKAGDEVTVKGLDRLIGKVQERIDKTQVAHEKDWQNIQKGVANLINSFLHPDTTTRTRQQQREHTGVEPDKLKRAVQEGNRDLAGRRDIDAGAKRTTDALRTMRTTLSQAQAAAARTINSGVAILRVGLQGTVHSGFAGLVSAVNSLKPHIDAIAGKISISVNRLNTGGTARPSPSGPQNRPGPSTYVDKGGGRGGGRASGGPVWPGTWTVGEDGPELLHLASRGQGYVSPMKDATRRTIRPGQTIEAITNRLDTLHRDFQRSIETVRKSKDLKEVAAAAGRAAADIFKGIGNVATTKETIALLKRQLESAKNPELKRALQAALSKVEGKLPGREWIAQQQKTAREIVASQKPTQKKVTELTAIQRDLTARGDRVAASTVGRLIVKVSTTHRDTSNAATLHNRYGATASGAGAR